MNWIIYLNVCSLLYLMIKIQNDLSKALEWKNFGGDDLANNAIEKIKGCRIKCKSY